MASFFNLSLDTIAPAGVSVKINDDAIYTTDANVSLAIATTDETPTGYQMKIWGIKDVPTEDAATWQTLQTSKDVELPAGDGLKTVYVKIRDDVGNESTVASDSITLDTAVPEVTITGPDKAKISKVEGFDTAVISFVADVDFVEYKVGVVSATNSLQAVCTVLGTTGGSSNVSGTADDDEHPFPKETNITVTIKGADLEAASAGDGEKIVKVFVRNAAGTWSVA